MKRALLIVILIFLIIPFVYAQVDFKIGNLLQKSQSNYEDGSATFKFLIEYDTSGVAWCTYSCHWYHSLNPTDKHSFELYSTNSDLTETGEFTINLKPNQDKVEGTFYVFCERKGTWGCVKGGGITQEQPFSTNIYGYNGDEDCQSGKESCAISNDCSCSKEGKSLTGKDLKECVGNGLSASCNTYCNNGVCEASETCSTCSADCKKCDGLSCTSPSECKGNYCVNEKCSSKPYIENDGICNTGFGENCKNSLVDCACKDTEKCGQSAQCETYCGNGVCEQEEAGICKADCQWCGDGICNANENCKMCDLDCGKCKEEDKSSLIGSFLSNSKENEVDKVNEDVKDVQTSGITGNVISNNAFGKNNSIKTIILVAIVLLTLLVLIYGGRKIWKNKKENTNVSETFDKDKRIKELKNNLKKHEREIKKLIK